jgi:DNA-binding transcriptional ArsR family regulator
MSETTTKDQVLEALSDEPMSVADLVTLTDKSDSTVRKALKELSDEGSATKGEDGGWTAVTKRVRANHGYARNTKTSTAADARDEEVISFLQANEGRAPLVDIFEGTSCPTKRAAYHVAWRLIQRGIVQVVERKFYELVEQDDEAEAEAS